MASNKLELLLHAFAVCPWILSRDVDKNLITCLVSVSSSVPDSHPHRCLPPRVGIRFQCVVPDVVFEFQGQW